MHKTLLSSCLLAILLFMPTLLHAQGCSDAGLCTLSGIRQNSQTEDTPAEDNTLVIGTSFGEGDFNVHVLNSYLEFQRRLLSQRLLLQIKLNYNYAYGDLTKVGAFGDLFVLGNLLLWQKDLQRLHGMLGVKIPLNGADLERKGISLPMNYQSSLGTTDLLVAFTYMYSHWGLTLGYQQPLQAHNRNEYLPIRYVGDPSLDGFDPTRKLNRRGDLLLRLAYAWSIGPHWVIRPSVLPIIHLGDDKYTDLTGRERSIEGSSGLTLNTNLSVAYRFGQGNELEFTAGAPLVTRDVRPDGLTRKYVLGLQYQKSF